MSPKLASIKNGASFPKNSKTIPPKGGPTNQAKLIFS
jgi:hypothetical protein